MRRIDWGRDGPKLVGAGMLIFCLIFWAFTDRVEPLFVTTGGGLLGIGLGADALAELRQRPSPPPTSVPTTTQPEGDG